MKQTKTLLALVAMTLLLALGSCDRLGKGNARNGQDEQAAQPQGKKQKGKQTAAPKTLVGRWQCDTKGGELPPIVFQVTNDEDPDDVKVGRCGIHGITDFDGVTAYINEDGDLCIDTDTDEPQQFHAAFRRSASGKRLSGQVSYRLINGESESFDLTMKPGWPR